MKHLPYYRINVAVLINVLCFRFNSFICAKLYFNFGRFFFLSFPATFFRKVSYFGKVSLRVRFFRSVSGASILRDGILFLAVFFPVFS